MLQIVLTLAIFVILVIPTGRYMYHIASNQKTFADPVFDPVDKVIYRVCKGFLIRCNVVHISSRRDHQYHKDRQCKHNL